MEAPRKRRSRVIEVLQKQAEDAKAAQEESGGDQPFPDLRDELGLGNPSGGGER